MLPPPETEPKQVSMPAAAKDGAKAVGTFFRVWVPDTSWRETMLDVVFAGLLIVSDDEELPLPLLTATAPAALLLSDWPTPTPVAVAFWASAVVDSQHNSAAAAIVLFIL
jgi:hypothetical protein